MQKTPQVEQWRMIEIELTSKKTYNSAFADIQVDAVFSGPDGVLIQRPVFWDGGKRWKIRFAPPKTGIWKMTTVASNKKDPGLHNVTKTIQCIPYAGTYEIYKKGFLRLSSNNRYFTYDDGTPFFYLGDTHWLFIHEKFDTSNVPGIPSQFKYIVDKRVLQGFTVYQSEAIQHPHGVQTSSTVSRTQNSNTESVYVNLRDGLGEDDIPGFKNIDRKFAYIAEKGLVHANSTICWAIDPADYPEVFTETYMNQLGRYWAARYGAYPVLWTMAQEIDKNMYGRFDTTTIKKWFAAAAGIAANDAYHQPLTAHMEDVSHTVPASSWWSNQSYHNWWALQWQGWLQADLIPIAAKLWTQSPVKPAVLYEPAYEGFWTDAKGARGAGYKAFQNGVYGYGYGANGVWNHLYSQEPADYGTGYEMPARYLHWYEGANLPGANQLTHLKNFYTNLQWWKLIPRFGDTTWASFTDKSQSIIATDEQRTIVVYFFNLVPATGVLKNLQNNIHYKAEWFNPRTGSYHFITEFEPEDGKWPIPLKPDGEDWLLLVRKKLL